MDSRHELRYDVEGEAEVFVGTALKASSLVRGHILDLSTTGCYIRTLGRVAIKRGAPVHIEFKVCNQSFRVRASSRFSQTKVGIGFNFIDMELETRDRLYAVVTVLKAQAEGGAAQNDMAKIA